MRICIEHYARGLARSPLHLTGRLPSQRLFASTQQTLPSPLVSQTSTTNLWAIPRKVYQTFRSMTGKSEGFKVSPSDRWWPDGSLAIVTGANKGIGKAAAQLLADNGLKTIVAARDEGRGQEAVEDLKKVTGSSTIHFEQLDISDKASVEAFAKRIEETHKEVSILINNAGIAFKGNIFGGKEARQTLDTNFEGTKGVCEAIKPLMVKGGRIVNVCSMAGKQSIIKSPELKQRFVNAKDVREVETLANEFVAAVTEADTSNSGMTGGWPGSMYGISKLCEATYTRILGEQNKGELDVNACCPGYVDTDMTSHRGYKSVIQGADTPVWLALLAPKGTTAKFFSERREESF